jgi:secondary thiamine-phosphate synthase enzyme
MQIRIDTKSREQLADITGEVERIVSASGVEEGVCHLFCRHTTAALTVNENADPDVKRDLLMALGRIVDNSWPYCHGEGNSPAHIKSSLLGPDLSVPVRGRRLSLGTWQGILFAEFDGPRTGRTIEISVISTNYQPELG